MSLAEVQARTAELQARLRALGAPVATVGGVVGRAAAADGAPPLRGAGASGTADGFGEALAAASRTTGARPGTASWGPAVDGAARRAGGTSTGEQAVALASRHLGTPYVWGGEQPGGFDCSGLLQWTYRQLGVELPRVSTDQARAGRAVTPAEARPGDLVFFERGRVDHIGLYAGDGQWVVAPKTGDVVKVEPVDLTKATTIRRVLPDPVESARRTSATATTGSTAPASATTTASGSDGWAAGLPPAGRRFADDIASAARGAGVDPRLLAAVAWSESGFDPSARSSAGAQGIVQLMPRTAASLGVDPMDPSQALAGGARYLAQQLSAFGGSSELALAAYNAGPTAVRRHGGVPPYAETQRYVTTVLDRYRDLGGRP